MLHFGPTHDVILSSSSTVLDHKCALCERLPIDLQIRPPMLHELNDPATSLPVHVKFVDTAPLHEVLKRIYYWLEIFDQSLCAPERVDRKDRVHDPCDDRIDCNAD